MIVLNYLEKPKEIPVAYVVGIDGERTFRVLEDIFVTLSDGYELFIEEGFTTDLISVPKWAWSIIPPFDDGLIGDLIHDKLWKCKQAQLEYFEYNIYQSRKFADDERKKWRESHVPEKKFRNFTTHSIIRAIGGFYYSRQIKIPN